MRMLWLIALALWSGVALADVRVATWNINGVEKSDEGLAANARTMQADVGPLDVLILQEVISDAQVRAIARALDMPYWAISDLSPPVAVTGNGFRSLEVAVLSRIPIEAAAEWDTTGREPTGDGFAPRVSSSVIPSTETFLDLSDSGVRLSRGFLRVDLRGDLSIYAVHWKSSRGEGGTVADLDNAAQRERQAEGVAADARRRLANGGSVLIGGDLNIQAPGRGERAGTDPAVDCTPGATDATACGPDGPDGYDDSVHLLLQVDPKARLLSLDVEPTFVAETFEGGAIDHLMVAGPLAESFSAARTPPVDEPSYAGSDHRPVYAVSTMDALVPASEDDTRERLRDLMDEVRQRLDEIEALSGTLGSR